jgi:hypothetical protein
MSKPQYYNQETFIQNMSLENVWEKEINGKNITIMVTDTGIFQHSDLCNVDRSKSLNTKFYEPKIYENPNNFNSHGTQVASLIAGQGKKYFVGAAPKACLIDLNIMDMNDNEMSEYWLKYKNCVDIYNNSWGYLPVNAAPKNVVRAFKTLTEEGRDGKGNIIVFAAGNTDSSKNYKSTYYWEQYYTFDTSMNYFLNSRYTISVGATDNCSKAPFSTRGSGILCCATLTGTYTAFTFEDTNHHDSMLDSYKYNSILTAYPGDKYGYCPVTNCSTETSFASAIVSGVCALLLQYRCDLTWRDVKELISVSCCQLGVNGTRMNGDKRLISELTGYGILNASKLIHNACKWKLLPKEQIVQVEIPIPNEVKTLNLQQDYHDINLDKNISLSIYVTNDIIIETVQLSVDINSFKDKTIDCCLDSFLKFLNGNIGGMTPEMAYVYSLTIIEFKTSDIRITLTSPSGTTVIMSFGNFFENIYESVVPIQKAFIQYEIDHDKEVFRTTMKNYFDGFIPHYASFEAYASTWLKHLILSELFRGEKTKGKWTVTFNDIMFDFVRTISGNELPATFLTGARLIFAGHNEKHCTKCVKC